MKLFHPAHEQGLEIEVSQVANEVEITTPDEHEACNNVIKAQVKCITMLKNQIRSLNEEIAVLNKL